MPTVEPQVLSSYNVHINPTYWHLALFLQIRLKDREMELVCFSHCFLVGTCQAGAGACPHLAGVLAALWVASTQHAWQELESEVEGARPAVETLTGSFSQQL